MKNVVVIGTAGVPACYGGFETLVENLLKNKTDDISYTVFCSSRNYKLKLKEYNNAKLIYLPISANGFSSIIYDILSLIVCLFKKYDTVLILGVSGCIFLPVFKMFSNSKIITNIDGLEWRRDKWNWIIKKFLKFSEKLAVIFSDVVVADNDAITKYVKNEYNIKATTIAYGGEQAVCHNLNEDITIDSDFYLSICRIEPENNIEMILEAFINDGNNIKFIGNWNNSKYGSELKNKYSHYDNVELLDPIYDIKLLSEYRYSCKGYIHGHSAGGTNPSLVEMMHLPKPIFCYDCDFNRFSTESSAYFFKDSNALIKLLNDFDKLDASLKIEKLNSIANKKYRWDIISVKYKEIY